MEPRAELKKKSGRSGQTDACGADNAYDDVGHDVTDNEWEV